MKDRLNRLLEQHHIFGKAHDPDLMVTLCLNCHREITEGLAREGISMYPETNRHKLMILVFEASAVLFESLAKFYRKWANVLKRDMAEK
jgi:hypothetical protein